MPLCRTCGQDNPEIARFCLACGTSLSEAAAPGVERRIVTVIFVDLVGFTARAERLDPEEVQAVLTPYHERVRREIESFGGVVEKFIGDAVMGLFGAPLAHGDDAERAVRAALVVRDYVDELAGGGLQVRIAVNTGEAVVSLGARPTLGESMVAGDVVNTAARLQAAAPVNGVVGGEDTYRETRSVIQYEATEPVVARGKEHPVEAWIAVRALTEAGERPLSGTTIVGRDSELAILHTFWERAPGENLPHLVSIFGSATKPPTATPCSHPHGTSSREQHVSSPRFSSSRTFTGPMRTCSTSSKHLQRASKGCRYCSSRSPALSYSTHENAGRPGSPRTPP